MAQLFLTKALKNQLIKNGLAQKEARENERDSINFKPVVKFFDPCGAATWLISEIDAENPDLMYGLCDLGMNCTELGMVSISELQSVRLRFGLKIERDYRFKADKTLSEYSNAARELGYIAA
tara:strand:+ start:1015 stop:1380 length:366 start_codon:yes stop_codon:yes gene_type:complete